MDKKNIRFTTKALSKKQKELIEFVINKVVVEYKEALRMMG